MRINNTPVEYKNIQNKQISHKGGREILRTLSNPDSLASTVVLESFVTGGRSVNAYKRGGFYEFRERFTDDVVSAIFWMKGVDIFNTLGDKFGQKVLKLPTTEFDVGKDALRTPFQNVVSDLGQKVNDTKALKTLEKKLAVFKFTKIILSALLATGFVGFALPRINQAITNKLVAKNKMNKNVLEPKKIDLQKNYSFEEFDKLISNKSLKQEKIDLQKNYSFEEFNKNISNKAVTSFKGAENGLTFIAHCLENNRICKMLTTDAGILTGRVTTARNKDEAIEYGFRDIASSFFYYASTPLIYKGLQSLTKKSAITEIDSVAAKQVHDKMLEQLKNADGTFTSMNVKEFAAKTFGVLDDKAKGILSKLPFNSDVISLTELSKYITDENLLKKAAEMSKLQPKQANIGSVLTKQQVADVLKSGSINTPEFMQKIFKSNFGEALTNPYKFISMKKITSFRTNIDKYGQAVIDAANKTNGGIVDKKLLEKINKKSFVMSSGFRFIAMALSALALGVAIPKIQYAITAKRTGSTAAPGLRSIEDEDKPEIKSKKA